MLHRYKFSMIDNYGGVTDAHKDVISSSESTVLKVIRDITVDEDRDVFTICDYGTADAVNSMTLFGKCIDKLRKAQCKNKPIHIVYEDQAINDFGAVFKRIEGFSGEDNYLQRYDNVFVSCVGRSFYQQCLPNKTVHFGFSSTAVNWLSCVPVALEENVFFHELSTNDPRHQCFVRQAELDWRQFLLHRARELVNGGYLVVLSPTSVINSWIRGLVATSVRKLFTGGFITNAELSAITFTTYYRNEEEFCAPFEDHNSVIYKAGLRLVSYDVYNQLCPFRAVWRQERKNGDTEAADKKYANAFANSVQAWSESTVLHGLDKERSHSEKMKVIDEFVRNMKAVIEANPEVFEYNIVSAQICIHKTRC